MHYSRSMWSAVVRRSIDIESAGVIKGSINTYFILKGKASSGHPLKQIMAQANLKVFCLAAVTGLIFCNLKCAPFLHNSTSTTSPSYEQFWLKLEFLFRTVSGFNTSLLIIYWPLAIVWWPAVFSSSSWNRKKSFWATRNTDMRITRQLPDPVS